MKTEYLEEKLVGRRNDRVSREKEKKSMP